MCAGRSALSGFCCAKPSRVTDHFQRRRDQIQHLADILIHHAQITAAIGAAAAKVQLLPLLPRARCAVRDPEAAAGGAAGGGAAAVSSAGSRQAELP